jgi:hypothetical protein
VNEFGNSPDFPLFFLTRPGLLLPLRSLETRRKPGTKLISFKGISYGAKPKPLGRGGNHLTEASALISVSVEGVRRFDAVLRTAANRSWGLLIAPVFE